MKKIFAFFLGFLLLPFCYGVLRGLVRQFSLTSPFSQNEFFFYSGILSYIFIWLFFQPKYIYVWGHELTHALYALFFKGKVTKMKVSASQGAVWLTRTNFLVALAPYFFPFYTFLFFVFYFLLKIFLKNPPYLEKGLFLGLGLTIAMHLLTTLEALRIKQSDLSRTGTFFSLVFIFIMNIIIVTLILKMVSPAKIQLNLFFKESWVAVQKFYIESGRLLIKCFWLRSEEKSFIV